MRTNKYDDVGELLNRVHTFLSNLCRDARCDDHCSACIEASDLADDVYDLLHRPRRNCDVGTAKEQAERYSRYCDQFIRGGLHCERCPCCGKVPLGRCEFAWMQMPYESEA